jgi:hypothetical protein
VAAGLSFHFFINSTAYVSSQGPQALALLTKQFQFQLLTNTKKTKKILIIF